MYPYVLMVLFCFIHLYKVLRKHFLFDFFLEDPWASKQQIVSDSPQKEKKKSKKRKKAKKEIKIPVRKKALESEAMVTV